MRQVGAGWPGSWLERAFGFQLAHSSRGWSLGRDAPARRAQPPGPQAGQQLANKVKSMFLLG